MGVASTATEGALLAEREPEKSHQEFETRLYRDALENKAAYEKDESELQPRLEPHALALDSYKQAISHGYHNIPRPKEPHKTNALMERDKLLVTSS